MKGLPALRSKLEAGTDVADGYTGAQGDVRVWISFGRGRGRGKAAGRLLRVRSRAIDDAL